MPDGSGVGENGYRGEGIKNYKQVVTEEPWVRKVQCKKWSSQKSMDVNNSGGIA